MELPHSPCRILHRHAIRVVAWLILAALSLPRAPADTVALWLFDEQQDLYPSCVLGDAASGDYPLILGPGGRIGPGRFGNALDVTEQPPIELRGKYARRVARAKDRTVEPLTWSNANFSGLLTRGEHHLRQDAPPASVTRSRLNLGLFDWTVEFWFRPSHATGGEGVVFEIGQGPRGENDRVTRLLLSADRSRFVLENQPSGTRLEIRTNPEVLRADAGAAWHHLAFVYDAAEGQLRHYVDGSPQPIPAPCRLKRLAAGDEDYLSIGRDGQWRRPLPGAIDELRFSAACVYRDVFTAPESFSRLYRAGYVSPALLAGPPLLFDPRHDRPAVIPLGGRKHLFLDDALVASSEHLVFRANPPRATQRIFDGIRGHLVVFENDQGEIFLYLGGPAKSLAVITSRDGLHWQVPDLGRSFHGARNIVIEDPVGLGTVFSDPNAPPNERIKYFSGYRGRGCYLYSSPDGLHFQRDETAVLPFRAASQSLVFYDDQRQCYVGYHRSDMAETAGGKTQRTFVMTETRDVLRPWPLRRVTQAESLAAARTRRLGSTHPWYLDNGPLTPPGFGIEYPTVFAPDPSLDPPATDIYVPKCLKYAWAPDAYLAFPVVYFHYQGDGPPTRRALGRRDRGLGSGTVETQLAVSRNGIDWHRYPRPVYIGIGPRDGIDLHRCYIAQGMVRRGDAIWQYYLGNESYHSPWGRRRKKSALYRVVQRVDRFVAATTPYTGGTLTTRPLVFDGNRLVLNIDTGATGFAQVGLVDAAGDPIAGFGVDDCVYINGDFTEKEVEWLGAGSDVSRLAGMPVRLVFRMRGSRLFAMQFVTR